MEMKRDTYVLMSLLRWLVENVETYYHKEDILMKVADATAAYELDMAELIKPKLPDPKADTEWAELVKEVANG